MDLLPVAPVARASLLVDSKIFLQVTGPTLVIGSLPFAACLVSAW
jgi:hypothetical protein